MNKTQIRLNKISSTVEKKNNRIFFKENTSNKTKNIIKNYVKLHIEYKHLILRNLSTFDFICKIESLKTKILKNKETENLYRDFNNENSMLFSLQPMRDIYNSCLNIFIEKNNISKF